MFGGPVRVEATILGSAERPRGRLKQWYDLPPTMTVGHQRETHAGKDVQEAPRWWQRHDDPSRPRAGTAGRASGATGSRLPALPPTTATADAPRHRDSHTVRRRCAGILAAADDLGALD